MIITVFVIMLSTVLTAPLSHGRSINKDTDWFDYNDPKRIYEISNEAELIGLCSLVNEEQIDTWKPNRVEYFEGVTIKLIDDIELTQPWIPIGIDESICFKGQFDGNGHTISGLEIKSSYGDSGLFGFLPGNVRNLTVEGENASYDSNCGSIAGTLTKTGRIENCKSTVNINGYDKCGGIVGNNEGGTVDDCSNSGIVSGTYKIGGIVGENWGGTISDCTNYGTVKSTRRGVATYGTGGISGRSVSQDAKIINCENRGDILSNTEATGGIAGFINGIGSTINNCHNIGNISIKVKSSDKTITTAYVGGIAGIVGTNGVIIKNCNNAGSIQNPDISGGIIGRYRNTTEVVPAERYIRNNHYIYRSIESGIGSVDNDDDPYIDKASLGVSSAKMNNLISSGRPAFEQLLMAVFSPGTMIKNVSAKYAEAKDMIKTIKEKEIKNHEQQ